LLVRVAEAAINEAQARAELLSQADNILGEVEREEANRLQRVLNLLVPELSGILGRSSCLFSEHGHEHS
jgi:hypothetical protein